MPHDAVIERAILSCTPIKHTKTWLPEQVIAVLKAQAKEAK